MPTLRVEEVRSGYFGLLTESLARSGTDLMGLLVVLRAGAQAASLDFSLAVTTLAYAQPQRTFVSAQTGNDANTVNNCSVTQPCPNFNAAIGVVNAGGEAVALDPGGHGLTTIGKAVTLTGPTGVYVAIRLPTPTLGSFRIALEFLSRWATNLVRGNTSGGHLRHDHCHHGAIARTDTTLD